MKKRIISILAVLAMASLLLPTAVLAGAETAYPLWVAGIQVTESNLADVLGDGDGDAKTVAFDPQTNTLTLNGAHISETGDAENLMLWAVLLTVSAAGTLVCYGFSRKRSRVR